MQCAQILLRRTRDLDQDPKSKVNCNRLAWPGSRSSQVLPRFRPAGLCGRDLLCWLLQIKSKSRGPRPRRTRVCWRAGARVSDWECGSVSVRAVAAWPDARLWKGSVDLMFGLAILSRDGCLFHYFRTPGMVFLAQGSGDRGMRSLFACTRSGTASL